MRLKVLDKKETGQNKGCILCTATLDDYLASLGEDFDKYDIQRNIVNNPYLDDIAATVFSGKHIPVISLVVEEDIVFDNAEKIEIGKFRILDGLQRTWRLKTLKSFVEWLMKKYPEFDDLDKNFCSLSMRSIPATDRKEILDLGMTDLKRATDVAKQVLELKSYNVALDSFSGNKQWFEVWYGLDQDEIIKEMLLLNAGHRTMSGKHQIELLYLNWLDLFSSVSKIEIIRDKDIKSAVRFVQDRKVKQYRFSDLVMATLAFCNGRVNDIQSTIVMRSYENIEEYPVNSDKNFYTSIITFIADMDECLAENYPQNGREWFGRANIMEAFCAATGAWINEFGGERKASDLLKEKVSEIKGNIVNLNLESFDIAKNKLDATKVSIGQRMKKVVYQAVLDYLRDGNKIDWDKQFSIQ